MYYILLIIIYNKYFHQLSEPNHLTLTPAKKKQKTAMDVLMDSDDDDFCDLVCIVF